MAQAHKAGEPSMDEILASIRKIIAEEPAAVSGPPPAAVAPGHSPAATAPASALGSVADQRAAAVDRELADLLGGNGPISAPAGAAPAAASVAVPGPAHVSNEPPVEGMPTPPARFGWLRGRSGGPAGIGAGVAPAPKVDLPGAPNAATPPVKPEPAAAAPAAAGAPVAMEAGAGSAAVAAAPVKAPQLPVPGAAPAPPVVAAPPVAEPGPSPAPAVKAGPPPAKSEAAAQAPATQVAAGAAAAVAPRPVVKPAPTPAGQSVATANGAANGAHHERAAGSGAAPPVKSSGGVPTTIEDTLAELLRPMVRQWLDENMSRAIEKAIRVEVANSVKMAVGKPGSGDKS